MTVCVAAICELDRVVCVSDRALTMFEDWTYEPTTSKVFALGAVPGRKKQDRLAVLYAGDSSIATEVVRELHRMILPGVATRPEPFATEDVAHLYRAAYGQVSDRHAYGEVLESSVTADALRRGKHTLAPEVARYFQRRLQKFRLPGISIILAGIDPDGAAHLWQSDGPKISCLDVQGFAVIGSGAFHAASRMMIAKWGPRMSQAEGLLHAYEAKKEADEIVGSVGLETDIMILIGDEGQPLNPQIPQGVQIIDAARRRWLAADAEHFADALELVRKTFGGAEPQRMASTIAPPTPPAPAPSPSPAPPPTSTHDP